jgi:hypothetical protein
LPRGTLPGPSAPSPNGSLASLFPVVTPAPAAPGAGLAQHGPASAGRGADGSLTADTRVIGTGQGRLIVLALTLAAGIAALGTWFTFAGPARKLVTSLARRRGHHGR